MKNFSFSLTAPVQTNLQTIELLRREILSIPLSPRTEHALRFSATVARIHGMLALGGTILTRHEVQKTLTLSTTKEQENTSLFALKRTLSFISEEWTVNPHRVTFATLESLALLLGETGHVGTILVRELKGYRESMQHLLDFLAASTDHPITSATVVWLETMAIHPLGTKTTQFSLSLFFLILHKYGFDLRGMLAVLPYWIADTKTFAYAIADAHKTGNFSGFLDFTIQGVVRELEEKKKNLTEKTIQTSALTTLFTLTDRQKEILSLLDDPAGQITNRVIKKRFRISQITASRELTKLAALGLLYPHGKGRSVYYTKA